MWRVYAGFDVIRLHTGEEVDMGLDWTTHHELSGKEYVQPSPNGVFPFNVGDVCVLSFRIEVYHTSIPTSHVEKVEYVVKEVSVERTWARIERTDTPVSVTSVNTR
jgi:hypothetical protein